MTSTNKGIKALLAILIFLIPAVMLVAVACGEDDTTATTTTFNQVTVATSASTIPSDTPTPTPTNTPTPSPTPIPLEYTVDTSDPGNIAVNINQPVYNVTIDDEPVDDSESGHLVVGQPGPDGSILLTFTDEYGIVHYFIIRPGDDESQMEEYDPDEGSEDRCPTYFTGVQDYDNILNDYARDAYEGHGHGVGYILRDLDGNGSTELLIMGGGGSIIRMYTSAGGTAYMVIAGGGYYLCSNGQINRVVYTDEYNYSELMNYTDGCLVDVEAVGEYYGEGFGRGNAIDMEPIRISEGEAQALYGQYASMRSSGGMIYIG